MLRRFRLLFPLPTSFIHISTNVAHDDRKHFSTHDSEVTSSQLISTTTFGDPATATPESPLFTLQTFRSVSNSASRPMSVHFGTAEKMGTRENGHFDVVRREIDGPCLKNDQKKKQSVSLFGLLDHNIPAEVSKALPHRLVQHPLVLEDTSKATVESIVAVHGPSSITAVVNHDTRALTIASLGDYIISVLCEGKNGIVKFSVEHKISAPIEREKRDDTIDFDKNTQQAADISTITVSDETKYLVLGSKNIFCLMRDVDIFAFVNDFLEKNQADLNEDVDGTLHKAAQALVRKAYDERSNFNSVERSFDEESDDSISVTIIMFQHPTDKLNAESKYLTNVRSRQSPPFSSVALSSISNETSIPLRICAAQSEECPVSFKHVPISVNTNFNYSSIFLERNKNRKSPIISSFALASNRTLAVEIKKEYHTYFDSGLVSPILKREYNKYYAQSLRPLIDQHPSLLTTDAGRALVEVLVGFDNQRFQRASEYSFECASNALVGVIDHETRMLTIATLGHDLKALLFETSDEMVVHQLSLAQHTPHNPSERARLERLGHKVAPFAPSSDVEPVLCVDDELLVSRCLGGFKYKIKEPQGDDQHFRSIFTAQEEFAVSNVADVTTFKISDKSKFMVIGNDAVFEDKTHEQIGRVVKDVLNTLPLNATDDEITKNLEMANNRLCDNLNEKFSLIVNFH